MTITIIHKHAYAAEEFFNEIYSSYTFIDGACQYGLNNNELQTAIYNLRTYLSHITDPAVIKTIRESYLFKKIHHRSMQLNMQYYSYMQLHSSFNRLADCNKLTDTISKTDTRRPTDQYYTQELTDLSLSKKLELQGLNLDNTTGVCIQGGVILETASVIHSLYKDVTLLCLEKNYQTSVLAQFSLNKKRGTSNTTLIYTNPAQFDFSGVDRVYIPNIAKNKTAILQRIQATAKKPLLVFVQYATGLSNLFYQNYTIEQLTHCSIQTRKNCDRVSSRRELHTLYLY